jgi:hypothetical protein
MNLHPIYYKFNGDIENFLSCPMTGDVRYSLCCILYSILTEAKNSYVEKITGMAYEEVDWR